MKFSIYNTILPIGSSKYLLYNAAKDTFVIFKDNLYPLVNKRNPDEIHNINKVFSEQLIESGAIINDNIDELAKIKELSESVIYNDSIYDLIINPTMSCNFSCWYCYETHDKSSRMDTDMIERTKLLIDNIIATKPGLKYFKLSFFGGEPLLYFKNVVMPIMSYVKKVCEQNKISDLHSFTTNGYLINDEMLEWFNDFEDVSFQITLDGNREKHNSVRFPSPNVGSYDNILQNVKQLLERDNKIMLRINYTKDNIDSVANILDDIQIISAANREKLTVNFQRVWQDSISGNIDDMVYDIICSIKEKGFNATEPLLDNVSNPCYADRNNCAVINYNGDVYKCTARDFVATKREGYLDKLGNIIWENDALNKRLNIKFKNQSCLKCRIMPLCGGGCSQKAIEFLEKSDDYCIFGSNDEIINHKILDRFYAKFMDSDRE